MKLVILLSGFFFFSLGSNCLFSQNKTAHLNYKDLVNSLPEAKKASQSVDSLTKRYQLELDKLQNEYQIKNENFKKEEATYNAAIKELKQKEIKDLETSYNNFKKAAQSDIDLKDKLLSEPILKKIKESVEQVAKEKGYSYVIDSSVAGYIYMDPKDDILQLVKNKLGVK